MEKKHKAAAASCNVVMLSYGLTWIYVIVSQKHLSCSDIIYSTRGSLECVDIYVGVCK